jgi:hypothetical protein
MMRCAHVVPNKWYEHKELSGSPIISAWIADYNTARPHSSLDYKTPAALPVYSPRREA